MLKVFSTGEPWVNHSCVLSKLFGQDNTTSEYKDGVKPSFEDGNLSEANIDNASDEDKNNWYMSASCKETSAKVCAITKKLRYSPNPKAEYEAAILVWQRHKNHGVKHKYHVDKSDFDLARDLVDVLNLFFEITLQIAAPIFGGRVLQAGQLGTQLDGSYKTGLRHVGHTLQASSPKSSDPHTEYELKGKLSDSTLMEWCPS
ncbi:hypothetical protein PSTG_15231 [Puccinia striiformis f. sp. tritici PST-78]|uniref:Uncharacterized protein n=1 Tax=Puccinia striiformis f. sp. tritici PST-78 TaxID=1165861 RepID=A0A0L0UWP3_9BASI|nr:hypothetical protein PSTG_15231 [Puccinia striiformis f. sp. tritici PST-78]